MHVGSLAESNTTCPLTIVRVDREGQIVYLRKGIVIFI